jgi:tetratricopeptide (TPR) repeat protein
MEGQSDPFRKRFEGGRLAAMATINATGWLGCTALAFSVALPFQAAAVTDADRLSVYQEFRTQFDAKQYAAAKPLAEKLVQLTEEQYGPEELQLSTPLSNLGTVNYKLGEFRAAVENYQRSLRILQAKSTMADKLQIRPLHGLGVSLMGTNDPESAVVALKRAADLSRNTEGLFNINQIEFIDPLIAAYGATGRFTEADKEALYALRVEEAAYGRGSVKLIGRLDKLARWYEDGNRYTTERSVYERSLAILQKYAPESDLRRVGPLRGIARSYRLEQFYGEEGGDNTGGSFNTGGTGAQVFGDGGSQRRGETTLTAALAVIDANNPVDQQLRGEVLADLGDWNLIANAPRRAFDSYAESWKCFQQVNNTRYLDTPRILAYRPSISSVERSQVDPAEAVLKKVELHFRVDRDGKVDNVTSPTTDVSEGVVRSSISAMRRARYAPRIENGAAVATDDVIYIERVLVKESSQPSSAAPPSGKEAGKAAEKPETEKEPEKKPET